MIKRFWHWLRSYPMFFLWSEFTDVVVNKPVNLYVDRHGRLWMAHHRWAWFRVESSKKLTRDIASTAIYARYYGRQGQ